MRYFKRMILVIIICALNSYTVKAELTVKELIFDESMPYHLKIIDIIPKEGIVQIGNDNSKNTIIENVSIVQCPVFGWFVWQHSISIFSRFRSYALGG